HQAASPEAGPALGQREGKLDDGEGKLLSLDPLLAHQAVDAEHRPSEERNERRPAENRRCPRAQVAQKIEEIVAAVLEFGDWSGVLDEQEAGHERPNEGVELV